MNIPSWVKSKWLPIVVILALLFSSMLFVQSQYIQHVMIMLLYTTILSISFRVITLMGQWTFAHVTTAGIAAYMSAMLSAKMGYPIWASVPIGIIVVIIFSTIFALLTMRVQHVYYFFLTWAAAEAVTQGWLMWNNPFGGFNGITQVPPPSPWFDSVPKFFYLALVLTLITILVLYRLEKSRFGRTLKAINENVDLCRTIGVNIFKYRVIAYVIASAFAGLAGVFYAHYNGHVIATDFGWVQNWFVVIYLCVGGYRTMLGPIIGTVIMVPAIQLMAGYRELIMIILGAFTVAIMIFFPIGIEGVIYRKMHPEEPPPIIP